MSSNGEERTHPKKKPKGKPVEFDRASLKNWVTGFGKRKQQRREYGAIQLAKKQRIARNEARKLRRDAMKIQDRLTGAFGEKHENDSDDELGAAGQNPEEFEAEQKQSGGPQGKGKKRKENPAAEARHEDEEAVVTVVTREDDSEEEDDLGSSDDEDDDELGEGRKLGFPWRRKDAEEGEEEGEAAKAEKGHASTAYNPSAKQQQSALLKAKHALKAKDKMRRKGISGGHAFKKPKLTSKKKKIKFGHKKGANRDR